LVARKLAFLTDTPEKINLRANWAEHKSEIKEIMGDRNFSASLTSSWLHDYF